MDEIKVAEDTVQVLDGLSEALRGTCASLGAANKSLLELGTGLDAFGETLSDCRGLLSTACDELAAEVSDLQDLADSASESVDSAFDAIEKVSGDIITSVGDLVEATEERFVNLGTDVIDRVAEGALEPIDEFGDHWADEIHEFVEEHVGRVLHDAQQKVIGDALPALREKMDELIGLLQSTLEDLRRRAISASDESSSESAETLAMMKVLETVVEPIRRELSRVQSLASTVGISL